MATEAQIKRGDGFIHQRTTKSGEQRYQARWHDGVKWRAKTFASMDDAEDHLRVIGRRRRRGQDVTVSELTLRDVVDDYLERGASRWSANTSATYGSIRDRALDSAMGRRRVTELTAPIMQRWIDRLGKTYSPARVEMVRAVVGGALKEALRLGIIDTNPIAGVRLPKVTRPDYLSWTPAQIAIALNETADDLQLHAYYVVALATGMRPGEIRALRWTDINWEQSLLTCQRSITRDASYRPIVGTTTKTGKARTIALPEAAVDQLKRVRADQHTRRLQADTWHDDGLVFDRGNGAQLPQQTIWRKHRDLCDRLDLPRIRLHDLRHLFASTLLARGVNIKTLSDILGHQQIATTLDIYVQTSDDLRRKAADALADLFVTQPQDESVRESVRELASNSTGSDGAG